jgi:DNA-binding NtrC family response regulator
MNDGVFFDLSAFAEDHMAAPMPGRLLVVDDEVELMSALRDTLGDQGFDVVGATSGPMAIDALRSRPFDLLLSDLMMPGMDGIQLLRAALEIDPDLVGIIMTGQGSVPTAVEAMKVGAFDYLLKPFKLQAVLPVLKRALEVRRLRVDNRRLRTIVERLAFEGPKYRLIGSGPAMKKVVQMIEKVAPTDATVLVRGETGTGKELVARAVHHNSPRKGKPLVTINCAALQENLLESELFGHEKGSFTGAAAAKPGLVEIAEGGTLFIDEVAEMASGLQAKLLRVLEDGHYRRVGGTRELRGDVRVIAATNKPLEEEQKAGRFREDLYYRLNVVSITLPALRERREDIPELVEHFLATRPVGPVRRKVSTDAMHLLTQYAWPGNVRELANVIERAQILAEGDTITPDDLPETVRAAPPVAAGADSHSMEAVEKRALHDALRRTEGNKSAAAKMLGVSPRTLYRMIERYGPPE